MGIGLLGGTGIEGKGLALRFALAGASVLIGSRSEERAREAARKYNEILGKPLIDGLVNREVLKASELVFLTVPFDQVVAVIEGCREDLAPGLILVDVTVPIKFQQGRPEYLEPAAGSNSEMIASRLPEGVRLVAAFKTIPAHVLAEIDAPLECDLFVCSDSQESKERVIEVARLIPSVRPLDAGPLRTARTLERMTALAIHLNHRYKKKGARYRIVGL